MNKLLSGLTTGISVFTLSALAASCVDHDYDLTEDIDMTVAVGGDKLTLPASSLEALRLTDIFDLDDDSSIKEAAEGEYGLHQGDYVLVQAGDPTKSDFTIGNVELKDNSGSTTTIDIPTFVNPGAATVEVATPETSNTFVLKADNVTTDLVALNEVTLDMDIDFAIGFTSSTGFTGKATLLAGYEIIFDNNWTVEAGAASANTIEVVNGNIVRFTTDISTDITNPIKITVKVVKVNLTDVPQGHGLYAPGHFLLNSSIKSKGTIRFGGNAAAAGAEEKVTIVTETSLSDGTITAITGIVDPKITIADSRFNINDIPDFLADEENSLDVDNPRFYVTVTNTSPVAIELNADLASFSNSNPSTPFAIAKIGAKNGTDPVIIDGNGTTVILVSQQPLSVAGTKNIVVANLSDLIRTIPDFMIFDNVEAEAVAQPVTLVLAPTYDFTTEYEAVIPLAFGADMFLHYTDVENDWDVDDLDKYNFKEVVLNFTATNTIPLTLTPQVVGLDRNGNEVANVTAEIIGTVEAGSMSNPAVSPLEIHLRSTGDNIGNLDGVRLVFDAVSDPAFVGENLNANQNLVFTDVTVTVLGGAIIDLN